MLRAILLDLDNTLVLFDEADFYLRFMERIFPFFEDLMTEEQFQGSLLGAIRHLRDNNGDLSNKIFFINTFCSKVEIKPDVIWSRFMQFYQTGYDKIPVSIKKPAGLEQVLSQLKKWNLILVLATNPIFPELAQIKRLGWTGLDIKLFDLLTHMENMSFAKPRKEYYHQICEMIGISPKECFMVGNDPVNDMVAGVIGIKTFLTLEAVDSDYRSLNKGRKLNRGQAHPFDFSGSLAELIPTLRQLYRF